MSRPRPRSTAPAPSNTSTRERVLKHGWRLRLVDEDSPFKYIDPRKGTETHD